MSGNCAKGMRSSESDPAIVMMIAMTIANRGRSTKTDEINSSLRMSYPKVLPLAKAPLPRLAGSPPPQGRRPWAANPGRRRGSWGSRWGSRRGIRVHRWLRRAGPGDTTMPGRARCTPSTTTVSPSCKPEAITAVSCELCPSCTRRCATLLPSPTTQT